MNLTHPKIQKALEWLKLLEGENFLLPEEHCKARDIFQARLDRMSREMEKSHFTNYPLVVAAAGELGNNSFDHNLGNWRDEPGIYFWYDLRENFFIVADRGQGVLASLKHVKPMLQNANEALKIAFTEAISGRAPERRGNGLKFVEAITMEQKWDLYFQSETAVHTIESGQPDFLEDKENFQGVIAFLFFK